MSREWRVGRHQPRNVYRGDEFVAVVIGPDDEAGGRAAYIAEAVNLRPKVRELAGCAARLDPSERHFALRPMAHGGCGWCGDDHLAPLLASLKRVDLNE